jgi:hypothetical protein
MPYSYKEDSDLPDSFKQLSPFEIIKSARDQGIPVSQLIKQQRCIKLMTNFVIGFYGFPNCRHIPVPRHIEAELIAAESPQDIERIISEHETELAQLHHPDNEFLVCDTAAELMADVLRSKGIAYQIICGVNDEGNAHSYIKVGDKFYDPTHQGFGDGATLQEA